MPIDTVRVRTDREAETPSPRRRVFDVSEVPPDHVVEYARDADDEVHLERKGGRTYLVAEA